MTSKADRIAAAWVTACRATGDDPLRFGQWGWNARARQFVFAALSRIRPPMTRMDIVGMMGCPTERECMDFVLLTARSRQAAPWWAPDLVFLCFSAYREGVPQDVSHIEISEARSSDRQGAGRPKQSVSLPMPGDKETPAPDHPDAPADRRGKKPITLPAIPFLKGNRDV